jgi:hypothetical protein
MVVPFLHSQKQSITPALPRRLENTILRRPLALAALFRLPALAKHKNERLSQRNTLSRYPDI